MKISVIHIGDTRDTYLQTGISVYEKRLKYYCPVEMIYLTLPRNTKGLSEKENKDLEAKLLLSAIQKTDHAVLLDAKGRQLDSSSFSLYIQQIMNRGTKNLGFVIGGAYGFSDDVYKAVKESISLSKMTFSHQLVRLIFAEQLYRAFTIIRGEPYHHE